MHFQPLTFIWVSSTLYFRFSSLPHYWPIYNQRRQLKPVPVEAGVTFHVNTCVQCLLKLVLLFKSAHWCPVPVEAGVTYYVNTCVQCLLKLVLLSMSTPAVPVEAGVTFHVDTGVQCLLKRVTFHINTGVQCLVKLVLFSVSTLVLHWGTRKCGKGATGILAPCWVSAGQADKDAGNVTGCCRLLFGDFVIIIIIITTVMYGYHVLINALSTHMIHIDLNMLFYTHVKHSPTKTIYIKYTEKQTNTHYTNTHTAMNSNVYDTDLYCTCLHVRAHAHTHTHTHTQWLAETGSWC